MPIVITHHFIERASRRGLRPDLLEFILAFGIDVRAAGATSYTVLEHRLPIDLQGTELARRARDWIVVAGDGGALMTCYRRPHASRFLRAKVVHTKRTMPRAA